MTFNIAADLAASRAQNEMVKHGFASVLHGDLMKQIALYEKQLKPDEEVGAYLASFGTEIIIQIEKVDFENPFFIVFQGTNVNNSDPVRLVQHVSPINVLLTAVKIKGTGKSARRIGFDTKATEENSAKPHSQK